MQNEEQQLIDNLFSRLKQAETQSGPRDAGAEQLIKQHLQNQPGAPYYMSQAILIQEAALKKLNAQVADLENRLAQAQQQQQAPQQSSGGFLSSLFGGGSRQSAPQQQQPVWSSAPQQPQQQYAQPQQQYAQPQQQYAAPPARGTGFLGGALQTAVGVAGGVVMADMLTSMFHHSQPEEIVNIINEPALPQVDNSLDTFNGNDSNNAFLNDNASWDNNSFADNNDFSDFGGGDYDDDDSFV
ncbi:DUF2076 domain-containing protein [Pantoea sp. SM3]|uniref:DUF2076 domain-containing protein n=1 Tax=Pantoea sp. SM3 TaxID=1628192 RepID=UPI0005F77CC1|nr:DUF2076 domain-containing protein [Pantoea sp. SM3]KJV35590.1 ABC transporter substrate-binding protein [Pantoea sp. SM3]